MKKPIVLMVLLLAESFSARTYLQAAPLAEVAQISVPAGFFLVGRLFNLPPAKITLADFDSAMDMARRSGLAQASNSDSAHDSPQDSSQEPKQATQGSSPAKHKITITFDYDFNRLPACSEKITKKCVSEFVVYDISGGAGRAFKLLSIPAPADATGLVKGINGTTPQRVFESGKHLIAVTAVNAKGVESDRNAARVWVTVP